MCTYYSFFVRVGVCCGWFGWVFVACGRWVLRVALRSVVRVAARLARGARRGGRGLCAGCRLRRWRGFAGFVVGAAGWSRTAAVGAGRVWPRLRGCLCFVVGLPRPVAGLRRCPCLLVGWWWPARARRGSAGRAFGGALSAGGWVGWVGWRRAVCGFRCWCLSRCAGAGAVVASLLRRFRVGFVGVVGPGRGSRLRGLHLLVWGWCARSARVAGWRVGALLCGLAGRVVVVGAHCRRAVVLILIFAVSWETPRP